MSDSSKTFPNLPIQVRRKDCNIGPDQFILQNTLKKPRSIQRPGTSPFCFEIILLFPRNLRPNQSAHEEWKKPNLQSAFFCLLKKAVQSCGSSTTFPCLWPDQGNYPTCSYECSSLPCSKAAPRWLLSNSINDKQPSIAFQKIWWTHCLLARNCQLLNHGPPRPYWIVTIVCHC